MKNGKYNHKLMPTLYIDVWMNQSNNKIKKIKDSNELVESQQLYQVNHRFAPIIHIIRASMCTPKEYYQQSRASVLFQTSCARIKCSSVLTLSFHFNSRVLQERKEHIRGWCVNDGNTDMQLRQIWEQPNYPSLRLFRSMKVVCERRQAVLHAA